MEKSALVYIILTAVTVAFGFLVKNRDYTTEYLSGRRSFRGNTSGDLMAAGPDRQQACNDPQCLFVVNPFHRCNKHNRSNRLIPIRAKITQPRNDSCRQHSKPFFFGILRHTELAGKQQKADPEHLSFQRIDPRTLVQDDNQKLQKKPCIKADPAELFYFSIFRMCNLLCHAVPFLWTTLSDRSFWIPALSDRQMAVRFKISDTARSSPPICGTQRV